MACEAENTYYLALLPKKRFDPQVGMSSCTHFTDEETETWGMSPASAPLCLVCALGLQAPSLCSPPSPQLFLQTLFKAFDSSCLLGEGIRTGASRRFILTFWFLWHMGLNT